MKRSSKANVLVKKEAGEQAWLKGIEILLSAGGSNLRVADTLLCGWSTKKPTAIETDSKGQLTVLTNVPPDYLSSFLSRQAAVEGCPLCVARQTSTTLLQDNLAVTFLWHQSLASGKDIFIQRYVRTAGANTSLVRAIWRPEGMRYYRVTNKIPCRSRRRSFYSLFLKSGVSQEERFLTRPDKALIEAENADPELIQCTQTFLELLKKSGKGDRELCEMVVELVQDSEQKWHFLRLVSCEMARYAKKVKLFSAFNLKKRPSTAPQKFKMSIKRLGQTILSIKSVLGLEITSGDRKRVSEHSDFSHFAPHTSLPVIKRKKSNPKKDVTYSTSDTQQGPSPTDMPPIFQFPTPREQEDQMSSSAGPERFQEIHEHIKRQNNSLFMRIHFQEELPKEKMLKELVRKSVDNIASEFDRLRQLGSEGRRHLIRYK